MRKLFPFFLVLLFALASQAGTSPEKSAVNVVPKPVSVKLRAGNFKINDHTVLVITSGDREMFRTASFFADQLHLAGGPELSVMAKDRNTGNANVIVFSLDGGTLKDHPEGYRLKITPDKVRLTAATEAGLFYGIQTLMQLLPPEICRTPGMNGISWEMPCADITDYPRYAYRGLHLDVSRHFFPKEFIKRYIDMIAMYKMNRFHWHLTDDNGWRIEIKKYPKLQEIAAWHVDHEDMPWGSRPAQQPGEKATYGGYYTQDDVREIVRYAADRYITIIPEIEMPAHSVEVLAAYPQFSCTGGPFTVPPGTYWPNRDILCAGNDSVFTFLEDVLSEVIGLFPSQYIHIGGDEADKTNWKACPKCQARIRAEGLKDEKELQSYFIRRIEKFILSKGRRVIGWDEILEGGLAPEATVMSWRGVEGAIAAARQGHDAIMTPSSYCYFDHYQAAPENEPVSIGGYTTLKKVYSFDPTPQELTKEEARHILGTQGNVWSEFIPTPAQAEYRAFPRMIALSEVAWSPRASRHWADFRHRMDDQFKRLKYLKVNYSEGSFQVDVRSKPDKKTGRMELELTSEQGDMPLRYTLDGNDVTASSPLYTGPVPVTRNGVVKAGLFPDGKLRGKPVEMPLIYHLAIGKPVRYTSCYSYRYPAGGMQALTDGLRGSVNHRDGLWQGFLGNDLDVIIDLGKEMPVNSVQMNFLQNQKSWIFLPAVVEYSLSSDGKKYHSFNEVPDNISPKVEQALIQPFNFQFMANTRARYIHIKAKNPGKCPDWHEGAGEPCWIFTDEIVVF